jgi:hypothetical protein
MKLRRAAVGKAGEARWSKLHKLGLARSVVPDLTSFIAITFRKTSIERTWPVFQACKEMYCLCIDSAYEL